MITIEEHRKPGDWRGYVHITLEDPETGEVVYHSNNAITLDARKIMAALLGPKEKVDIVRKVANDEEVRENGALIPDLDYLISEVHWGSGGPDGSTSEPSRDQHGLDNKVHWSRIAYPTAVDEQSVTFQSSIDPGDGPDNQDYSEVALMSKNGRMFARFAFPTLKKFSRLRLSVRWQIFFA